MIVLSIDIGAVSHASRRPKRMKTRSLPMIQIGVGVGIGVVIGIDTVLLHSGANLTSHVPALTPGALVLLAAFILFAVFHPVLIHELPTVSLRINRGAGEDLNQIGRMRWNSLMN